MTELKGNIMTYLDEIQNTIHLDSAIGISESFHNLQREIIDKAGFTSGLSSLITQSERDSKFQELEVLCEQSGSHPFIQEVKQNVFSEEGFRYFGLAFYAHIYHAFEDVIFGIAHHAPPSVSLRRMLINNLWDEFGSGDIKNTHLHIYEDSILSFLGVEPLQESEMEWIGAGYESEACLFAVKYGVDRKATATANMWSEVGKLPYKAALSATVFGSEFTPRHLFPPIAGCIERTGLPSDVGRFFNLHVVCDECHFGDLMKEFTGIIKTRRDLVEAEAGTRIMLEIRRQLFDHFREKNLFA